MTLHLLIGVGVGHGGLPAILPFKYPDAVLADWP